MKYLLLAEKPDQAKKYATALGKPTNEKSIWRVQSSVLSAEVIVAPAVGHLVERINPYRNFENWEMTNLPALPEEFSYEPKKDTIKRFNAIKKAVKEVDAIIIGTDPDREGEAIAYRILELIPGALKKVKYRLWANSLTKKGLEQAFANLRTPTDSINYFHEADARGDADWLVGFNLSPFVTIKMKEEGYLDKKDHSMSVGRVQTPIVSLIVRNDEAIENFKPSPYWQLKLIDPEAKVTFGNDIKYQSKAEAERLLKQLANTAVVKTVTSEEKAQEAPKLYNLTNFQSEMSKLYHFDATKTKELVQSLYQKGYLSYPRTDSTLITTNEFSYLVDHIEEYQKAINKQLETPNRSPRKNYVNDKKVLEHYAIIPTETIPDLSELSDDEKLVYQKVVFRTLLMFTPDYRYQSTSVILDNHGLEFKATGTVTKDKGWRAYFAVKKEDKELPHYQERQEVIVDCNLLEEMTKPPTRITEQILLKKLLPKYHLGTSATRDGMIDLIQDKGYVTKHKKTGQFFPTERGKLLIHYLDQLEIAYTNPETTGKWEEVLAQIGQGKIQKEAFVNKIKWAITKQIEKGKQL
ncbi:DNA topoisomerase [uncultured Streptococcus sp.]|uniref:DNA topoisomerase n=1 Tax=uncultured Streptococcus sp. TaxID=83427 RepID=UPI0028E7BDB7|nr:DNA topoisomerase [uncultured Streptococcus sp.]